MRHRLKWLLGMTVRPDHSYIEMTVKVINRTPAAQSFLFWINPAVHANTNYQVIFPPSTQWAVQHGKPEFASWPIARQTYGGVDYSRGVDISWWKNHPSPVSFFAWHCEEDFFGGYDHGREAGVVQVSNHHVSPGKKFFEWGNGPEGEMWTKILSDEDGPYLELMAGSYSDNQPDYSWIQPGEIKVFKHYWYPVRKLGGIKNANIDAAADLEVTNARARVAFNTTGEHRKARALLKNGESVLLERTIRISPQKLNLVAALIRGKKVATALSDLEFSQKRISETVRKTLESAIANAENNHDLDVDALVVAEAYVGKSIVMKRFHTRGRGRASRIEKPFSHLTIVVREVEEKEEAA